MNMRRSINPCRPGHGASCALCCGSHNYRADRAGLEALFSARRDAAVQADGDLPAALGSITLPRALADGTCCPLVGFDPREHGIIACLGYGNAGLLGELGSFFGKVCSNFCCGAWERLEDGEILFAARVTGDWYYYPLLIADIGLVRELYPGRRDDGTLPAHEIEAMKETLLRNLTRHAALSGMPD